MWKNIFIESCVLSALIFGGFYLQSNMIKDEIKSSDRSINESIRQTKLLHISGNRSTENSPENRHISGTKTIVPTGHLSGKKQNSTIK